MILMVPNKVNLICLFHLVKTKPFKLRQIEIKGSSWNVITNLIVTFMNKWMAWVIRFYEPLLRVGEESWTELRYVGTSRYNTLCILTEAGITPVAFTTGNIEYCTRYCRSYLYSDESRRHSFMFTLADESERAKHRRPSLGHDRTGYR